MSSSKPAKPTSAPLAFDASDLRSIVLQSDDFGHELRVGDVLKRNCGTETQHAGTYNDPISGKPRQFDFRTRVEGKQGTLYMAIECKNLVTVSPLVICGAKRAKSEAFHQIVTKAIPHLKEDPDLDSRSKELWGSESYYQPAQFVGKSILRFKPDNKTQLQNIPDSDIYDKWSQALSSAFDLVLRAEDLTHYPISLSMEKAAILPIVVVPNDTLWTAFYDDDGGLTSNPMKVQKAEFFVGHRIAYTSEQMTRFHNFVFSHIHFFTLDGFDRFTGAVGSNDYFWQSLFDGKSSPVSKFRHL